MRPFALCFASPVDGQPDIPSEANAGDRAHNRGLLQHLLYLSMSRGIASIIRHFVSFAGDKRLTIPSKNKGSEVCKMRLLIVDDHEVVRRGVRSLLLEQPEIDVCGEAVDGQDALDKALELKPDVILMDVSMPRLNGLEATRQIRSILPDCEVLILSQHENPEMARQALKAGARGYVIKGSISKDLISAVKKAFRREYFFDPAILDQTPSGHIDLQEILQRSAAFEQLCVKVNNCTARPSRWRGWESRTSAQTDDACV